MSNERVSYKVDIFGEQYNLIADSSPEHILSVSRLVDVCMREISLKSKELDVSKIAVLSALQIADQLVNLKNELEKDNLLYATIINKIEAALKISS